MDQPNFGNKKRRPGAPVQPAPNAASSAPAAQPVAAQQTAATKENGFAVPQRTQEVHPKRVWPD